MLPKPVVEQLIAIVGEAGLLVEAQDLLRYGTDRTTQWQAAPVAVVLPRSVTEVQAIVHLAAGQGLALVPSGGRTGLSGGAVASEGELVVAMDRMNQVIDFDPVDETVTVGAGMVTAQLQAFARQQGLFYPVDFASTGSSQIGGNIATNAGGIKVIKYGMTRDWVAGLKVVTGRGDVLDLNRGLAKNNTGYDLRHLFIGSEGTLGLVCEATIQLTKPPEESAVMVLGIGDFALIMDVLDCFGRELELTAFEFFSEPAMDKVTEHRGHNRPFETVAPYYVLLEFENSGGAMLERAITVYERAVDSGWVLDAVVSHSLAQAQKLWKLREDISETLWHWQPYKNDISVRLSRMGDFIHEVDSLVNQQYPDFEIVWYGHIGDGNLHLNILKPETLPADKFEAKCVAVSDQIGRLLARYEGSVSAEHGVGLLKKEVLKYSRSAEEIDMMRSIKSAFDPQHILNPGKLFD